MLALASWRLATFMVKERGPWDMALRLREWAGISHDEAGEPESWPDGGVLAGVLSCVWCCSFYTAVLMLVLWVSGPGVVVVLALGIAGGAVFLDEIRGRLNQ